MATAATGWGAVCTASITAQTDTTATITVTSYWQNMSWDYDINNVSSTVYCGSSSYKVLNAGAVDSTGVGYNGKVSLGSHSFTVNKTTAAQTISCYSQIVSASSYVSGTKNSSKVSVTVPAKTSYTVSYNANGGSGAPSAQTKWHGTALTLSATKPTRTGYTFAGWATTSSGSVAYAAGASYTANANVTLYAKWTANTYTVKYNANGGSGAPENQTKTYGVNLTLSSTKPTRTNYNFKGWGTSASSTTVAYAAGATYSSNAAITLYAIWELAYVKPRITGFSVARCDSSGAVTDEGTYALVKFNWVTDKTVSSIKIQWKLATASSYSSSATVSASGTSGSVSQVVGANALSTDNTYDVQAVVADSDGSTATTGTLQGTAFPIDFLDGSKGIGVAFGKPAETANLVESELNLKVNKQITAGKYVNNATLVEGGYAIHDLRNVSVIPGAFGAQTMNMYFSQQSALHNRWSTIMSLTGWSGGNYATHELAFNSSTGVDYPSLYHRTGTPNLGYIGWRAILDEVNFSGYALPLTGGAMSGGMSLGNKTTSADGKTGIILNKDGYITIQHSSSPLIYLVAGSTTSLTTYISANSSGNFFITANSRQYQYTTDRFRALSNSACYLGDSNYKWISVYATNGTIQTSDKNMKENIVSISDKYKELFKRLKPVTYELKGGEHDRVHIGLIAQDVKEAMDSVGLTSKDLAAYCVDYKTEYDEEKNEDVVVLDEDGKPIEMYSLRYTEFIALNTHMIQKQQAEIEALKAEIAELKELIKGTP